MSFILNVLREEVHDTEARRLIDQLQERLKEIGADAPMQGCRECKELMEHRLTCALNRSAKIRCLVQDTERAASAPKCAGLEGCHELEGVMYDLFVHDPKCPKGALPADRAASAPKSITPLLQKIIEICDAGSAQEFDDADERLRAIRGLIIGEAV